MTGIPATVRHARLAASVLGVAAIAALGVTAPYSADFGGLAMKQALAGRGGDHGGDHGGGHSADHGRGHGVGGMSGPTGTFGPAGNVHAAKADKAAASLTKAADDPAVNTGPVTGDTATVLGSLNAAHAAEAAFANASSNSVVGKLSAYMEDIKAYLDLLDGSQEDRDAALQNAASDLAEAANKDDRIDGDTVDAVNTLLDGKSDGFTHDAVEGDPVHDAEPVIADLANPPAE